MKKLTISALTVVGFLGSSLAIAQTPPPAPAPTDPSSASSPHQRDVTKKPGEEAAPSGGTSPSDASTPAQKQSIKKHKKPTPATPPSS